jgi:arginine decarboxylase
MRGKTMATNTPLLSALRRWADRDCAPFYTPGHKQGQGMGEDFLELWQQFGLRIDLPELPGLDNLAQPQGVIQESQQLAAELFGATQTRFLVNGSTAGVIAAMLATCQPGDRILLPRNVHRSAIAGLIHGGLRPVFVEPEYIPALDIAHGVTVASVAAALAQYPDLRAILVVSPTYYGVSCDVRALAQLAHAQQIPLIVDAAHGAHFGFHPGLPPSPLAQGADIVIQSTHKLLGALTQAAMLHLRSELVDMARLDRCLQILQTSSPSYWLLASLDSARAQMANYGYELLDRTLELTAKARSALAEIPGLLTLDLTDCQSPGCFAFDPTRLTVTVNELGWTGFAADEILCDQHRVIAEMPSLRHLTFIVSIGNRDWDLDMLVAGMRELAGADRPALDLPMAAERETSLSEPAMLPRDAFFANQEMVPIEQAVDRISVETICPYPPGIPVLLPGERVTGEAIASLQQILEAGGEVVGAKDPQVQHLSVAIDRLR